MVVLVYSLLDKIWGLVFKLLERSKIVSSFFRAALSSVGRLEGQISIADLLPSRYDRNVIDKAYLWRLSTCHEEVQNNVTPLLILG